LRRMRRPQLKERLERVSLCFGCLEFRSYCSRSPGAVGVPVDGGAGWGHCVQLTCRGLAGRDRVVVVVPLACRPDVGSGLQSWCSCQVREGRGHDGGVGSGMSLGRVVC
jgi:hypothetical protein